MIIVCSLTSCNPGDDIELPPAFQPLSDAITEEEWNAKQEEIARQKREEEERLERERLEAVRLLGGAFPWGRACKDVPSHSRPRLTPTTLTFLYHTAARIHASPAPCADTYPVPSPPAPVLPQDEEAREAKLKADYEAAIPEEVKSKVDAVLKVELATLQEKMDAQFKTQEDELTAKIAELEAKIGG